MSVFGRACVAYQAAQTEVKIPRAKARQVEQTFHHETTVENFDPDSDPFGLHGGPQESTPVDPTSVRPVTEGQVYQAAKYSLAAELGLDPNQIHDWRLVRGENGEYFFAVQVRQDNGTLKMIKANVDLSDDYVRDTMLSKFGSISIEEYNNNFRQTVTDYNQDYYSRNYQDPGRIIGRKKRKASNERHKNIQNDANQVREVNLDRNNFLNGTETKVDYPPPPLTKGQKYELTKQALADQLGVDVKDIKDWRIVQKDNGEYFVAVQVRQHHDDGTTLQSYTADINVPQEVLDEFGYISIEDYEFSFKHEVQSHNANYYLQNRQETGGKIIGRHAVWNHNEDLRKVERAANEDQVFSLRNLDQVFKLGEVESDIAIPPEPVTEGPVYEAAKESLAKNLNLDPENIEDFRLVQREDGTFFFAIQYKQDDGTMTLYTADVAFDAEVDQEMLQNIGFVTENNYEFNFKQEVLTHNRRNFWSNYQEEGQLIGRFSRRDDNSGFIDVTKEADEVGVMEGYDQKSFTQTFSNEVVEVLNELGIVLNEEGEFVVDPELLNSIDWGRTLLTLQQKRENLDPNDPFYEEKVAFLDEAISLVENIISGEYDDPIAALTEFADLINSGEFALYADTFSGTILRESDMVIDLTELEGFTIQGETFVEETKALAGDAWMPRVGHTGGNNSNNGQSEMMRTRMMRSGVRFNQLNTHNKDDEITRDEFIEFRVANGGNAEDAKAEFDALTEKHGWGETISLEEFDSLTDDSQAGIINDRNGDGTIDHVEQTFADHDLNGDGEVTLEEVLAFLGIDENHEQYDFVVALFKGAMDTDGSGGASFAEYAAYANRELGENVMLASFHEFEALYYSDQDFKQLVDSALEDVFEWLGIDSISELDDEKKQLLFQTYGILGLRDLDNSGDISSTEFVFSLISGDSQTS